MKRSPSQRLQPIRHVAESREQGAARRFTESQRRLAEAEAKLRELRGYLQDYQSRRGGLLDPLLLENHGAFIKRLRDAEAHQSGAVERARRAGLEERERWLKSRRETQILERLATIYQQREQLAAARGAQKLMDELAARQHGAKEADEY